MVIPTFLEAETIAAVVAALPRDIIDRVVVVDGGSPDGTAEVACRAGAEVITVAREGIYPLTMAADVSEERLRRFFIKEHRGYRARRELRECVLGAVAIEQQRQEQQRKQRAAHDPANDDHRERVALQHRPLDH